MTQDKFLMLKAWHASVSTLTVAFNLSSTNFVSKMHDIDGFGRWTSSHLAVKEVSGYLGVSGHDRFSHDGLGTHTLRSRREEWCIRVLWMHMAASATGDELAATHPGVCDEVWSNCDEWNHCGRY